MGYGLCEMKRRDWRKEFKEKELIVFSLRK